MQKQFQYIKEVASQYHGYNKNTDLLYQAINNLEIEQVKKIYEDYANLQNQLKTLKKKFAQNNQRRLNICLVT